MSQNEVVLWEKAKDPLVLGISPPPPAQGDITVLTIGQVIIVPGMNLNIAAHLGIRVPDMVLNITAQDMILDIIVPDMVRGIKAQDMVQDIIVQNMVRGITAQDMVQDITVQNMVQDIKVQNMVRDITVQVMVLGIILQNMVRDTTVQDMVRGIIVRDITLDIIAQNMIQDITVLDIDHKAKEDGAQVQEDILTLWGVGQVHQDSLRDLIAEVNFS